MSLGLSIGGVGHVDDESDHTDGGDYEVGVEVDDMPNTPLAVPLFDPNFFVNAKPKISSTEAKKSYQHWRKPFILEGYEINLRTSLRGPRKLTSLICRRSYFECGFRLPIPQLCLSLLNYWRKSSCQLTTNAYTSVCA